MARRRGNAIDFTGVEPGGFPLVAEGDYNVLVSEMYIYTHRVSGNDVLAVVMNIEDHDDYENQKLFLNHALTEQAKRFVLGTLIGLGFVTDDDRGEDGKKRVVIDYEVDREKNFKGEDSDMVTNVIVNESARSTKNRRAIATVTHKVSEYTDESTGKPKTRTQANVSKVVTVTDDEDPKPRSRKKFGV